MATRTRTTWLVLAVAGLAAWNGGLAAQEVDYLGDVKPLLKHKCYACHGALKQRAGLRLDTGLSILKGGESGPSVVPGNPDDSLLIQVLTGDAGFQMPPANLGSPLDDQEFDLIRQWIADGAVVPKEEKSQTDPRAWWSYRPITRPPPPPLKNDTWSRSPVDHFIAARRSQHKLGYAAEASRGEWLRRVYLDLIGLPPTRMELHEFLADDSQMAYESVVDDVLSRPQYGERWGRHWMDIWRYSDWYGSRGINEIRYSQRHIWRWRDWIVDSLNDDKGYDQMVREMLAADEIAGDNPQVLPATGYLGRNWYKFDRNVWMFETVERTGEAFLGLTLRCARCHDHKYDPISQEDYYRFRAFFEPHDVRTDPVSVLTKTEKDATLGQVLTDGIPLVYDKDPDVPTYRFERGDNRYPDKTKPLTPGVPAALGANNIVITPIQLPIAAWYPVLRKGVRETLVAKAESELIAANEKRAESKSKADLQRAKIVAAENKPAAESKTESVFLHDDFSSQKPEIWKSLGGTWVYEANKLVEKDVTSFATFVTQKNHPRDFTIHLRYRPLQPGTYRSVGFSFDFLDKGNSQDVYTSTGDASQTVQAFHRTGGSQVYPPEGIVKTPLKVGVEATLDVSVLGSSLTIDLNGQRTLEYLLPIERRDGKFALWVHQGSAEFLELKITAHIETLETMQQRLRNAERAVETATLDVKRAAANLKSVQLRLAAALAASKKGDRQDSHNQAGDKLDAQQLALDASAAELETKVIQAELEVLTASHAGDSEESQKKLAAANMNLQAAREAATKPTGSFTPLGEQYPKTSTGRRSALANWITSPENPRTARVAVNHLWGRHFGQPLVATSENFGLNGRLPTHPQLLDWLAAELMAYNWRMKPLHRQIVLSATYRMSTRGGTDTDKATDADNIYFWRMNSRRMEAEVVRDSILYLSGQLDLTRGGPEIPETDGETVFRRSLYFRNTPNEKMGMLEVFDMADPNSCYRRKESVVPHQSLAMMNSGLTLDNARLIAEQLSASDGDFLSAAFETVLSRRPTDAEVVRCNTFLEQHVKLLNEGATEKFVAGGTAKRAPAADPEMHARENLVHVLLLHNDFVTVR
jgi:hypothetical protein